VANRYDLEILPAAKILLGRRVAWNEGLKFVAFAGNRRNADDYYRG
jgi:hypothetical protein